MTAQVEKNSPSSVALSHKMLFKNESFLSLWIAGSVSSFSLAMLLLIDEWYVVNFLKLPNMLGIVAMCTVLPRVIFMFIGGQLADRLKRSRLLFISEFSRGIMIGILALLLAFGWLTLYPLLASALVFGILDALYWPASSSLIPAIIQKENLVRANSVIQSTNNTLLIVGPAIGAAMIHFIGFQGGYLTVAGFLLIGCWLNLRIKEQTDTKAETPKKVSIIKNFSDTLAYIKTKPYLLTSMGLSVVINFFFAGPMSVGTPILVNSVYHGNSFDLSFMEGTLAGGMVLGSLLMGVINLRKKRVIANLSMIGVINVSVIFLSQTNHVWMGVIFIGIVGLLLSASNVNGASVSQSIIDKEYMGRVQSIQGATGTGLLPLSFTLVSFLLSIGVTIGTILLVSSCIGLLFIILVLIFVRSVWSID